MDERDYLEKVAQETPVTFATPPIPCQSCGKKGVFEAIKCSKCGHVFFPGNRVKDFPDRCPECKYSEMEEKRKKSTQRN
jgi:predicted Zn-ribbon and HTH transcriptional regulator